MYEFIKLFNGLMNGSLPTKDVETHRFIITVSADPNKVMMKDKETNELFTMADFNDREISLLAIISALEGL